MIKIHEVSDPNSCLNKAEQHEPLFVLLGRDKSAAHAIREWVGYRVASGSNEMSDEQIQEALAMADIMEAYAKRHRSPAR